MKEKMVDEILDAYFAQRIEPPEKSAGCPSLEVLERYASGSLASHEVYDIGNHAKGCAYCSELVEGALLYAAYGKHIRLDAVPERIKKKAKSLHPTLRKKELKMMRIVKKNIWLILSLASLITSFFVARYFLQFLILTVVFGLKWVFDKESMRALIMIYNTWRKHDKEGSDRLEEIFKDRL